MDECFPLKIMLPRYVKLENTRLTLLYWFLAFITLFVTMFYFIYYQGYYVQKVPNGTVQFWPLNWKLLTDEARELNAAEEQTDYCRNPKKYEYCDDPECSWSARAMRCIDLCTEDSTEDCIESSERWFKSETSLFFPTYFAETSTRRVGDDMTIAERRITSKMQIVKGVEDMGIGFQHDYNVLTPGNQREEGSSKSVETNGLLTILQDANGNDVDRWEPGERVSLSLKQIMQAGKISLDEVRTDIGRNFLDGAQIPDGILARLAGVDITLELSYHNTANYHHKADWPGPVCYITVHAQYWTSQTQVQVVDHLGSSRFRYYQGVRVRFKSLGSFSWISLDQIFNKLAQLLVFFGVAKQIVFYFSIFGLGVVSKVYKGFVFQNAALGREACGMCARLTSYTSTFVELKDNAHGISEERMLRRFKRIFEHNKDIDDAEIHRLVNFVFSRMAKDYKDGIDVQDYSHACTYGEALHFKVLVELFDSDRKKGFLERTFAGPTMRSLFQSDKNVHTDAASQKIDLSKSRTSMIFDAGYVAAPRQAVQVQATSSQRRSEGNYNPEIVTLQSEIITLSPDEVDEEVPTTSSGIFACCGTACSKEAPANNVATFPEPQYYLQEPTEPNVQAAFREVDELD